MNKTTEALKLAEEAVEDIVKNATNYDRSIYVTKAVAEKALAAIREVLADHSGDANEMVAEHKCGGCAKTAADGWALYCVECWEKAGPVKQEPVVYIRKDQLQRAMKYPCLCEISPEPRSDRVEIYAAPVGAEHFLKAIAALREGIATCRAEALEEAAKLREGMGALDAMEGEELGSAAMVRVADRAFDLYEAAIRRLK